MRHLPSKGGIAVATKLGCRDAVKGRKNAYSPEARGTTKTKAVLIGVLVGGAVITGLVLSQRSSHQVSRAVASRRAPARVRAPMSHEKHMRRESERQSRRARLAYE